VNDPGAVVLAGDWHGNTGWAHHVIGKAHEALKREKRKIILHAGDFGVWPGAEGREFLDEVSFDLQLAGMELWFVDGNHEWHPELIALREEERRNGNDGLVPIDRDDRDLATIYWIPRGHRWTWHRKTWMGLGGAVSVDAAARTKGKSWWPEETFTGEQLKHATRPGKVHVMLTHDSPSAVRMSFGQPPSFWDVMDLARSEAHREQLQDIVDKIQPEVLIHGHYHRDVRQTIEPYGTKVIGLDMDGENRNYTLFDTRDLFEVRPLWQWEEEMDR
jgi:predicted phosphodiesterase